MRMGMVSRYSFQSAVFLNCPSATSTFLPSKGGSAMSANQGFSELSSLTSLPVRVEPLTPGLHRGMVVVERLAALTDAMSRVCRVHLRHQADTHGISVQIKHYERNISEFEIATRMVAKAFNLLYFIGSGGALPPFPTPAKRLLSPPLVRLNRRDWPGFKSWTRSHLYRTRFHYRQTRK